jgi:HEAT repeat protein
LAYRKRRVEATGVFRRVRAIYDAVKAQGGDVTTARAWISQAFRWQKEGRAVEQKFAKFEVDPVCSAAMTELLQFVATWPDDMARPVSQMNPGSNIFSPPGGAFGRVGPAAPLPPPPQSTFQPNPNPFAPRNPQPPAPPPVPRNPNPFAPRPPFSLDPVPIYVAHAFDALATGPDLSSLPDWLRTLEPDVSPETQADPVSELPTDLTQLYRLYTEVESDSERELILRQIGRSGDLQVIDHFYSMYRGTEVEGHFLEIFTGIGGEVGMAGLLTLLPIASDKRSEWLEGVVTLLKTSKKDSTLAIRPETHALIWRIAAAETDPSVSFCVQAFSLVAEIGTPEAFELLWQRVSQAERDDFRYLLNCLLNFDPGDRLIEFLTYYAKSIESPHPILSPRNDPPPIRVPYERLEEVVKAGKSKISLAAIELIARIPDSRVIPLLADQLHRRVPFLREAALRNLRRLKAQSAADAVAKLMERDKDLQILAAEALCEWEDARCVPVLLEQAGKDKNIQIKKLITRIGKLKHPAFEQWILEGLEESQFLTEAEDVLIEGIKTLAEVEAESLSLFLERVLKLTQSVAVKQAIAAALPKVKSQWRVSAFQKLLSERSPVVSYAAAVHCKDPENAAFLMRSSNEIRRVLGVRVLWNCEDRAGLIDALNDKSPAVRDLALIAIGALHIYEAVPVLNEIIETQDRVDVWGMNPAVLAWRAIAKMPPLEKHAPFDIRPS